ncbi:hypothetical protein [Pararobbsia alpina]|uniref:hypothetical protein n=1 Tax=Pararobbsia alpina TaxID=621374 RepID=UPI0039A5FFAC
MEVFEVQPRERFACEVEMEALFLYAVGLVRTHAAWIGVNVVYPLVLPTLGSCLLVMFKAVSHRHLATIVLDTIRFGQLSWLAIAWSASAIFDGWQRLSEAPRSTSWMGWCIVAGFFISAVGTFTAVACSETVRPYTRHRLSLAVSVFVAMLAAATMIYTHDQMTR